MTTTQSAAQQSAPIAFHFRTETRTDAELEHAYLADKAKKDAKAKYEEALRLDGIREAERSAREAKAKTVVVGTSTTRVLTAAEREDSRRRAEAEALAARQLIDAPVNVVKLAPERLPISLQVLAAGLAADKARAAGVTAKKISAETREAEEEAYRVKRLAETLAEDIAREAAKTRLLEEGLFADRQASAHSHAVGISKSDMSLDEKDAAMRKVGFVLDKPAKGDRDARYYHEELEISFYLKGTAPGFQSVERPQKARGSAAMTPEQMATRAVENAALKAAIKAGKAAKPTQAQSQKAEKKAKAAEAAKAKAAKKRK